MDKETIKLARRIVKSKNFTWMPGMRYHSRFWQKWDRVPEQYPALREWLESDVTLDLADAATVGCLLALAREAWSGHRIADVLERSFPGESVEADGVLLAETILAAPAKRRSKP